jgi:hypothetical protein
MTAMARSIALKIGAHTGATFSSLFALSSSSIRSFSSGFCNTEMPGFVVFRAGVPHFGP